MKEEHQESTQARWARFRFAIVGPLLATVHSTGEIKAALLALSKKQWKHPLTGMPIYFSAPTIERWFYKVRKLQDPVSALRPKLRSDAGTSKTLSPMLKSVVQQQYVSDPGTTYCVC